jgi:hypothetical protein
MMVPVKKSSQDVEEIWAERLDVRRRKIRDFIRMA